MNEKQKVRFGELRNNKSRTPAEERVYKTLLELDESVEALEEAKKSSPDQVAGAQEAVTKAEKAFSEAETASHTV